MIIGAILGDIVGSIYEFTSRKTKTFDLFVEDCHPTDDSVMTVAVAYACAKANCKDEADFKSWVVYCMRKLGRAYPTVGYGYHFIKWLNSDVMGAYNSFGNGAAMRVSPVAWVADSLTEAETLAAWSADVTHNHPEGIKGAKAVAAAIYLARTGHSKDDIKAYIEEQYYPLDFRLDDIRPTYEFDVTCQGSVPQAIVCFLEATDFEDAVRNAVSLGGDADTQAAIAGAIAEAFFGVPDTLREEAYRRMPPRLQDYYDRSVLAR